METRSDIPNPAFTHSTETDVEFTEQTTKNVKQQEVKEETADTVNIGKYTFATLAIGKEASRYIAIFKKITQGNFIIPSKYAGLFGLAWLIYRRAAFHGFLAYSLLVFIAYKATTALFSLPNGIQLFAIFAFTHFIFYFFGNFLYWYSIRKKIDSFRNKYGDTSAMTYLSEKGGTIGGFNLIASIIMLQGSMLILVGSAIYMDSWLITLWDGFLELVYLKA